MAAGRSRSDRLNAHEVSGRSPTKISADCPREERLSELDDLYQRGVITVEERAAGRAKVIGGD
jgi:hypothetical protein